MGLREIIYAHQRKEAVFYARVSSYAMIDRGNLMYAFLVVV